LQRRLREGRGDEVSTAIVAGMLGTAGKKEIILRLLSNLKAIYLRGQQFDRALPILDWIIATLPDQPTELRDRE